MNMEQILIKCHKNMNLLFFRVSNYCIVMNTFISLEPRKTKESIILFYTFCYKNLTL